MMFMGSKAATKDVDLVVRGEVRIHGSAHSAHVWDSNPYVPGRNMPG